MTSRRSFFNLNICTETISQSKYIMILHAVALFLMTTIPGYINLQDMLEYNYRYRDYDSLSLMLSGGNPFLSLSAVAIGVITIVYVFSYLFKSNATEFYNSMPYTRSSMYISKFVACVVICILPILMIFVLNSIFYVAFGLGEGFPYSDMLTALLEIILSYMAVLSLGVFAVALSGNFFATVIIMGFSSLCYLVTTLMIWASTDVWTANSIEVSFNYGAVYLFPPAMLWYKMSYVDLKLGHYIFTLLYIAAFFAAGLICYNVRKSESVKNFFAFKGVGIFLKYYISLVGSLGFGALFLAIGNYNAFVGYIGYILMLFLLFSVMQAVFEKNMRGMFKNMKHFAILAVIWAIVLAPPVFGAFKNATVSPSLIKNADVDMLGITVNIRDRDQLNLFVNGEKDDVIKRRKWVIANPGNPIFNIGFALEMTEEKYTALIRDVFNSDDFRNELDDILQADLNYADIRIGFDEYHFESEAGHERAVTSYESGVRYIYITQAEYEGFREALRKDIPNYDFDTATKSGVFADFTQHRYFTHGGDNRNGYVDIPVYNCYKETVSYLKNMASKYERENWQGIKKLAISTEPNLNGLIFETEDEGEIELILLSLGTAYDRYESTTLYAGFTEREDGIVTAFDVAFSYNGLSEDAKKLINPDDIGIDELHDSIYAEIKALEQIEEAEIAG